MHQVFRRAENISWEIPNQETPLESLLLVLEERNQIVELNPSAALIWFWTDGQSSNRDISLKLSRYFNIPYSQAYEDVCEVFEMWQEDGLVF